MSEKQRILFLAYSYAHGGAERVLSVLLNEFAMQHLECKVAVLSPDKTYSLPASVEIINLQKNTLFGWLGAVKKYERVVASFEPHAVLAMTSLLAVPIFFSKKGSYNCYLRIAGNFRRGPRLRNLALSFFQNKFDGFIVNSSELATELKSELLNDRAKVHVIPNPLNPSILDLEPSGQSAPHKFRVGFFGRIEKAKRIDRLLAVFDKFTSHHTAELVICGTGPQKRWLQQTIASKANIKFSGFVQNPYSVMSSCDAIVLTSDHEGLPNVIMEAQALGVPVVSSDCDFGPRELIKHQQTGFLVKPDDIDGYVRCLEQLVKNHELAVKVRKAGRDAVLRDHNPAKIAQQYKDVLLE